MCLIFISYQQHKNYPLIVLANRDEFYKRPTNPAGFWQDNPNILGGRDLEAGGTWLGITKNGHMAMLTNYRDIPNIKQNAPTRGKLVSDYLQGEFSPKKYLMALSKTGHLYNGYNLIVGTVTNPWYFSNQQQKIVQMGSGLYGLSNGLLNSNWPKVQSGKEELVEILSQPGLDRETLFSVMTNTKTAATNQLPNTGLPIAKEKELSSRFIQMEDYGTRCTTLLTLDNNGKIEFTERQFKNGAFLGEERTFKFDYQENIN